jgi:omega-6 fatty acid desaturase (delta-12 desaturase)
MPAFDQDSQAAHHPTHRMLVAEMAKFAKTDTRRGIVLFAVDYLLFWGAMAAVVFVPSMAIKIVASVVAGIKMANLATIAHDGAHNSLTSSRRLNWFISVLAFMPCLFNYRLWVYDHHSLHHPHTNGKHVDSYRPLSKKAYDALPWSARLWVRFCRSPNIGAFGLYYICQRWWKVKLMPGAFLPVALRASAWKHFAWLLFYFAGLMTALLMAPQYSGTSATTALLLGFVVPFFIFQTLLAASLYFNHTHPDIPWFRTEAERRIESRPEYITVHLRLPKMLATLAHNFLEHPAHHIYPAIPCYALWDAQEKLNRLMGEQAIVENFSLGFLVRTMRICKLYDYERRCWLDFNGRPTTAGGQSIAASKAPSKAA